MAWKSGAAVYPDSDGDTSWLGSYADRFNWEPATGIYDRETGLMYDGQRWRDERGHFAGSPDDLQPWNHECRFIDIGNCQFSRNDAGWLKYAFQNANRLESFANDNWSFVGVRLELVDDDGEILASSAGCWGIESDSGSDYLIETAKEDISELEGEYLNV